MIYIKRCVIITQIRWDRRSKTVKKLFSVIFFVFFISLLFVSCDSGFMLKPVNELLAPPLYYSEYEELVSSFRAEAGDNAVLSAPLSGEHRSAITVDDLDGDGSDEAVVFYKSAAADSAVRVRVFDDNSGEWKSRNEIAGYGNSAESLRLSDMDGDGIKEMIINWSNSGSTAGKVVSLFRCEKTDSEYNEILNEMIFTSCIADIDNDGRDELMFIGQNTSSAVVQRYARAAKLSGGSVVITGEARVDANVSGYPGIKTEKVSGDSPLRIYVDAYKGEVMMITELIYWDQAKGELCAPFFNEDSASNSATVRFGNVECADINNDGSIEIPVQNEAEIGDRQNIDYISVPVTSWIDYDGEKINTVCESFINPDDGYIFFLEDDEKSSLQARCYPDQSCLIVSGADGDLFSVLKISPERWASEPFEHYVPVIEREDGVICVYITQKGSDAGITEETLHKKLVQLH